MHTGTCLEKGERWRHIFTFNSEYGLFFKSRVTNNKMMNETYSSTPGADFYGVGGLVKGVEVVPEHCVGSFTFPGHH